MLSTGLGEMDRLRAGNLPIPLNEERAGKDVKAAQNGDSFPEMLESIQKGAAEKAAPVGETSPADKVAGEDQALIRGENAVKGRNEETELLAEGEAESLADELEDSGEIDAALALESVLLIQAAESPQVSFINANNVEANIDIEDITNIAGEKAETKPDAAPASAALDVEKEADSLAMLSKASLAEAESLGAPQDADVPPLEEIKPFERQSAGKPESAETPLAAAEESKSAESGQEKAVFSIRDLRAGERFARDSRVVDAPAAQDAPSSSSDDIEMHLHFNADAALEGEGLAGKEGGNSATASGFSFQVARGGGEGAQGVAQNAAGASFAERLASELRNNAADIVRAGQIVLRNGGEGTIRLALHPETLGAVRIHLEMSGEKRVSGKITVSSREAWDAFSESMDSLVAAFSDEGFDAAGFDLSWAGRGSSGEDGRVSAPFYASSVPDVMPDYDLADDYGMAFDARRSGALYAVDIFA